MPFGQKGPYILVSLITTENIDDTTACYLIRKFLDSQFLREITYRVTYGYQVLHTGRFVIIGDNI